MTALLAALPFVAFAQFTGSVDPGSGHFFIESIAAAQEQGAEALLVRLDTPGGLLSTTREVVQAELSARVPIVVWVGPPGARAGSAGVFLTLAAHVAAMAPSSNIGAAHPVEAGGGEAPAAGGESTLEKKIENDTAAFVEGIAERRSRNVEWAEKAVRDSESITASQALQLHVIDVVAEDVPELLRKIDGRRVELAGGEARVLHTAAAELRPLTPSVRDRLLHFLADPEVLYLIAMLGALGVLGELYHPGAVVPGVVGVICILIAGMGFSLLPVHAGAALLILLGVALLAAELYAGGHGFFIGGGAIAIVVGSLLLVGHVGKGFYADPDFGLGWRVVLPVCAALALIAASLVWKISSSTRQPLKAGGNSLIGQVGEVRDPLEPEGTLLVLGELWKARSASPLPRGARAQVLAVSGLTLEVAPLGAGTKAIP